MLTNSQKIFLARSDDFQILLANDPQLSAMQADDDETRRLDWLSINEMLGGLLQVGTLTVQPITPAVWSFLWVLGNSYTRDLKEITEVDTDIFLWVLSNGVRRIDFSIEELPVIAAGTAKKTGLSGSEAAAELLSLVYHTFRPMSLLPGGTSANEEPRYDAFWLAKLSGAVSQETGESVREILFSMPLSACLWYYIAGQSREQNRLIYRRKPEEKLKEIGEYIDHLAEIFCEKHGIK